MRNITLLALVAVAASAPAQNLLVNGDFELSVPNSGTGNGWTAALNDGSGGWRSSGGNPNGSYILNDSGQSSTNPSIEQTLSGLSIGVQYLVMVDYQRAFFSSGSGVNDFGIEVDGNLWQHDVINDSTWRTASHTFVASASTVTLRFTGERFGDTTPRLDNASLEAVPEPATLALICAGAWRLARRKRTSR